MNGGYESDHDRTDVNNEITPFNVLDRKKEKLKRREETKAETKLKRCFDEIETSVFARCRN